MADDDDRTVTLDLPNHAMVILEAYAKEIGLSVSDAANRLIAEGIVQAFSDHFGADSAEHKKAAADLGVDIEV